MQRVQQVMDDAFKQSCEELRTRILKTQQIWRDNPRYYYDPTINHYKEKSPATYYQPFDSTLDLQCTFFRKVKRDVKAPVTLKPVDFQKYFEKPFQTTEDRTKTNPSQSVLESLKCDPWATELPGSLYNLTKRMEDYRLQNLRHLLEADSQLLSGPMLEPSLNSAARRRCDHEECRSSKQPTEQDLPPGYFNRNLLNQLFRPGFISNVPETSLSIPFSNGRGNDAAHFSDDMNWANRDRFSASSNQDLPSASGATVAKPKFKKDSLKSE